MSDRLERMEEKIDGVIASVGKVAVSVAALTAEVKSIKQCPNPGACVDLKQEVDKLKSKHSELKGAWKLSLVVAAVVSFLIANASKLSHLF